MEWPAKDNKHRETVIPLLADLFLYFLRLGLTAFGGPAMAAYIREMAVTKKKWLDEETPPEQHL